MANTNTKEDLIQSIKEWVRLDNEIRSLHTEITNRKKEKNHITEKLINVMKSSGLDAVDIKDGQICYTKKKRQETGYTKIFIRTTWQIFSRRHIKSERIKQFYYRESFRRNH